MKRIFLFLLSLLVFFAIIVRLSANSRSAGGTEENWGSFTPDKTYSYDEKYYALQSVYEDEFGSRIIKVTVYSSGTDEVIAEFSPARARDFWGICWESDTYNIWTQSADIGIFCYVYQNGAWIRDEDAKRPPDIVSKYD